ncbi:MAG TPA: response regulator transcription factor [Planctomycetota bacterium]|nr:response regulator transcription factor [Planctomycetota bacterium]
MSRQRCVLVVEDDSAIRTGMVDALTFHGFKTSEARTGPQGLEMALGGECDLVLLDLVLPGMDGLAVLKSVREAKPALPVIILTARGDESDRVEGLKLGADDYVVKPFSVRELIARIEAVLRRSPGRTADVAMIVFPDGEIDLKVCEIRYRRGGRSELSEREGELLKFLAGCGGRVVSRDEILQQVWRLEPSRVETRTIDMHIARLREKLRDDPDDPKVILTVRGRGYRIADNGLQLKEA